MRSPHRVTALLACLASAPTQDAQVVAGAPLAVELRAGDAVLEGHGPARRLSFAPDFAGTLFVWAIGAEVDLRLRIEDDAGAVLGEDEDSGGGTTPCLALEVEPARRLVLCVAASKPEGAGRAELHVIAAPESAATRAAAARAKTSLAGIQELRAAKDVDGAREAAARLVDELLAVEEGERSSSIASALAEAGVEAAKSGDLDRAEAALRRRCEQTQRCLPPDHRDVQKARLNLAVAQRRAGRHAEARFLQEQALAALTRSAAAEDPELLRARQHLGATLAALGELEAARDLQALTLADLVRTRADDDGDLQNARSSLASTLFNLGELARARELQEQVLAVRTRALPDEHADLQRVRSNLALTLAALGELDAARRLQEHVLEIQTRLLAPDSAELQTSRVNLSSTLFALGDVLGARELLERGVEVFERVLADDDPNLQRARGNLAMVLRALGDTERARELQQQCLQMLLRTLPPDHYDVQRARGNLAALLKASGDYEGARKLQEAALESAARALPDDHPELQRARANLAVTLQHEGDLVRALELKRKVVEVLTRTMPADDPELQAARENLASALLVSGDAAAARALEEQVLAARARVLPDDHPELQRTRAGLAWILAASGEWPAARELGTRAAASMRGSLRSALETLAPREAEERARRDGARTSEVLALALGDADTPPDPLLLAQAFALVEMQRSAALTSARLLHATRSDPGLEALRAAVRAESEQVARRAASGSIEDLAEAVRRRDAAQRELAGTLRSASRDATLLSDPDATVLARTLRPGEALIGYWAYTRSGTGFALAHAGELEQPHLAAFVLAAGAQLACVDLGPLAPIEAAVAASREAALQGVDRGVSAAGGGGPPIGGRAARLRELVLDPLEPALRGAHVVIVALDDVLHLVPLDALPRGDGIVGDSRTIQVRATLWELALAQRRSDGAPSFVGLGGIDYDVGAIEPPPETAAPRATPVAAAVVGATGSVVREGRRERGFSPLPETGAEVELIVATFRKAFGPDGAAIVLDSGKATRERLLASAPGARFVHLATHGYFAPESIASSEDAAIVDARAGITAESREERVRGLSPMVMCGLALAGANGPADAFGRIPGAITAEELSALDLSACELAVLSACDTNVGVRRAGQGVASLQKALHLAGARTVVSSLWRVPDESTRELMVDFYRRVWIERKPKSRALWEAKQRLRAMQDESGRPKYALRDWAGWVLTGAPD